MNGLREAAEALIGYVFTSSQLIVLDVLKVKKDLNWAGSERCSVVFVVLHPDGRTNTFTVSMTKRNLLAWMRRTVANVTATAQRDS